MSNHPVQPDKLRGSRTGRMSQRTKAVIQSLIFMAIALATFLGSLELPFPETAASPSPAVVPIATAIILFILAILLVVFPTETQPMPSRPELLRVLRTLLIFAAYVVAIPVLQFIIATWIFLIVILVVSGERKPLTVGLVPPVTAVVAFILFYSLLGVSVPAGGIELFIHDSLF